MFLHLFDASFKKISRQAFSYVYVDCASLFDILLQSYFLFVFFFLTLFWVDAVGGLVIINLSFLQVFSKWNLWGVKIDLNFVWHHVAILFLSGLNNGVEGQINFLIYVLRVFIQFCVGVFSWGNSSFFFSLGKVIHSAVNSQINLL